MTIEVTMHIRAIFRSAAENESRRTIGFELTKSVAAELTSAGLVEPAEKPYYRITPEGWLWAVQNGAIYASDVPAEAHPDRQIEQAEAAIIETKKQPNRKDGKRFLYVTMPDGTQEKRLTEREYHFAVAYKMENGKWRIVGYRNKRQHAEALAATVRSQEIAILPVIDPSEKE